jgi:hypothetical protein
MEKKMANIIDRLIRFIAPGWAYRRQRFRQALRADTELPAQRRPRDDEGWVPWSESPWNPDRRLQNSSEQRAVWPAPRPWTW